MVGQGPTVVREGRLADIFREENPRNELAISVTHVRLSAFVHWRICGISVDGALENLLFWSGWFVGLQKCSILTNNIVRKVVGQKMEKGWL